jgi:cytochrome c-type biogenesis protein
MSIATLGLALIAGILSTLSPCVLPLLPIVLGTAASQHRLGPVALAAGLAISFVVIGLFVATVGFAIGLDGGVFRWLAAALMIGIGVILMVPRLQEQVVVAAGPVGSWAGSRMATGTGDGLTGQFLVGLLLGAVWSPCVGPTLGAASVLAAQGKDLVQVAGTMLMFGIGAALPLLVIGLLSREAMLRMRNRMLEAGGFMKSALGLILVVVGLAVVTGADKAIEAKLVALAPEWLTNLTTRY